MTSNVMFYFLMSITAMLLAIAGFAVYWILRLGKKEEINYSLNLALILVSVPLHKDKDKKTADQAEVKKMIEVMEQFYSSIAKVKEGWLKGMFQGPSALAFEIALHMIGEEVHFYLSVPRKYVDTVEKQITGFLNGAKVEVVEDYNIFNPVGATAASYLNLSRSFFLPIKTYQNLETDPLNFIANAMSKLEFHGEGCAVQVLIKPNQSWQDDAKKIIWEMKSGKSFREAYSMVKKNVFEHIVASMNSKKNEEEDKKNKPAMAIDEPTIKAMEQKASKIGFDANIRLVASALTQTRAEAILGSLEHAFSQFENPNFNGFTIKRVAGKQLQKLLYNFSFRHFNNQQTMTLNTEELTSIFHFPTPYLETKNIKSLKARSAPMPSGMPAEGIIVGKNIYRGVEQPIRMAKDDRRRHYYVLGQTGTGKTVSMKNMIIQDIENGEGVCFIDPHGEAIADILEIIPKHRADDVIVFDPGDLERPMGINMLEYDPDFPEQKTFIVNEMISIFDKLYDLKTTGGPMFEQYTRYALLLIMGDPDSGSTLLEVPRVFSDPAFRKMKLAKITDPLVKNFWEKEAEKAGGDSALANITPYITSKFNTFLANEFMRPIVAQQKSSLHFRDIMDNQKILLVNLSKGRIGDINSNLLGLLIVGKILMAALSRTNVSVEERKDFYLYIDEFQNFSTDSISVILSEARKYRLSLVMAHQFISQLKEGIRDAVFGNVGSMMIFRTGIEDAEFLQKYFEPEFGAQDIANLDNLNAYARLLVNSQTTKPFNIVVGFPKKGNSEISKIIKELSRLKYGRDRQQIEMEIQERFKTI